MKDLWQNKKWGPMLLAEQFKPFNSKNHIFEIKYDGNRALVFASQDKVIIQNRHKQDISYLYPELQNIKKLVKGKVIFDGEIVSFVNNLPNFSKLQERSHLKNKDKINLMAQDNPIIFVCFDILYENGNLVDKTLMERKKILNKYKDNDFFIKTKYIEEKGIDLFKKIKKIGLEGIIAKDKNSTYNINERLDSWIKIKNWQKESFVIGGYIEKENSNVISLLLGEYKNDLLYFAGKVSMGKKHKLYDKLKKVKKLKNSPFIDYEDNCIYVETKYECIIDYMERTKQNHLRQPIYKGEK